jgi:putative FmdB family regulatory protein
MPIYEYQCTNCKFLFERIQRFSDPPVTACPQCGEPVRKVLQPVGIVFKGSGWYKTDSRSTAEPADGKAKEPAKDATGEKPAAVANGVAKPEPSAAGSTSTAPATAAGASTAPSSSPES